MKGWGITLVRFNNFVFLKGIYLNYTTAAKNNRNTLVYSRYVFLPRKTNLVERSIIEAKAIDFNGFQQSCQNCSHLKLFGILIYWDWNIYSQILCENGCSKWNNCKYTIVQAIECQEVYRFVSDVFIRESVHSVTTMSCRSTMLNKSRKTELCLQFLN